MTVTTYDERLQKWEINRFSPPPAPDPQPTQPSDVQHMPMRDGITLYTEIFLPESRANRESAYPVVLLRSPYPYTCPSRNDRRPFKRYLDEAYAVVFQITRGLGLSEGVYHFFRDDVNDGYDCIEWIAKQPWCNGNIGMEGASYSGSTQLLAARRKPPALKCIMPTAFVGNFTQCFPFSYGVPNKGSYLQWHQLLNADRPDDLEVGYGDMNVLNHPTWGAAFRKRPLVDAAEDVLSGDKREAWRETITNPLDNEYWAPVHFTDNELAELDIPIFFTDGWYDLTVGPIDFFTRLEKTHPQRADRYLLVGPWNHFQTYASSQPGENDGDRTLPNNGAVDMVALRLEFFDRYLKGKGSKGEKLQEDRVRVYITGAKNSNANLWKHFPTFPAPGTEQKRLYLHSQGDARSFPGDGTLNGAPATNDAVYPSTYQSTDQYLFDPALPTASATETSADRREVEIRSDVLTYTSEPFTIPLTILGEILLVLHAASDAPDTDWFAVITEVFPDGKSVSFHYAPPAFRARYREGFDREVFLTPNQPEEFRIPMGPAGHQIAAGNRLRLSIFSAAFPEYDPNSNTGNDAASDVDMRIAKQTIYHDILRPSHLIIPTIDLS
jgi:uncharacterized protein